MIELQGKVALVTGGNRGIGFAISEALAERGCSVVLTSRSAKSAAEATKKLAQFETKVVPYACDVRDEEAVARLFALVRDEFKHLDFLVNNAGIFGPAVPIDQVPTAGWREALDTNLTGTFLCARYAVPLMCGTDIPVRHSPVIVNNLSVASTQFFPRSAAYTASKAGALGLTGAIREDLREKGIRVVALMPGATDTEIWNQFWPDAPREKMIAPKDVASAVINALLMPEGTSVDEIRIGPAAGRL